MKRAIKLSYIYSAASVLIGPAIIYATPKHPSGWDCSDSAWGTTPVAAREAFYEHAARFMQPAATIMIAIGICVLIYLAYDAIKNKKFKGAVVPALLTLFMLGGYGLIIMVATSSWC